MRIWHSASKLTREAMSWPQIHRNLGLKGVRLITNNERKIRETEEWGVPVVERVALDIALRPENEAYPAQNVTDWATCCPFRLAE